VLRIWIAVAVLLAAAAPAHADSKTAAVPGTDLVLTLEGGLRVHEGDVSAPIPVEQTWPDILLAIDVAVDGESVDIGLQGNCTGGAEVKTTIHGLRARIANVKALHLHEQQKWEDAAAGFAQALALDPTFELASLNLASAQARGGNRDAAIATLLALAARNPTLVAWRSRVDPDLAELAAAPELARFSAATPSALDPSAAAGPIYSARLGVWAYVHELGNAMADPVEDLHMEPDELRVYDVKSGKLVVREAFHGDAAQIAALRALGFSDEGIEPLGAREPFRAEGDWKSYFGHAGLGVLYVGGALRVLRGDHMYLETDTEDPRSAWLIPTVGVVVAHHGNIGDGCGGWSYDEERLLSF
jgi:hypothetical protein